jgi:S1-C subfamily serine protease
MKKTYILLLLGFIFFGCGLNNNKEVNAANPETEKIYPQNDMQFLDDAFLQADQLISDSCYTAFSKLQKQIIERMEKNSEVSVSTAIPRKMNGIQMYTYLKKRTVLVSKAIRNKEINKIGYQNASGYIINKKGIVVTNWHPFDERENVIGMFVTTNEGKVYSVQKVLSASRINDIAILQLNTNGEILKELPLAEEELVGQDIYMMGHPFNRMNTMTKGIISRKYIDEFDNEPRIGVTADFAQGASGGPIVNDNGQLAGMVRATFTLYTGDGTKEHGEVQMIVKQVIPVSVIHKYVK